MLQKCEDFTIRLQYFKAFFELEILIQDEKTTNTTTTVFDGRDFYSM